MEKKKNRISGDKTPSRWRSVKKFLNVTHTNKEGAKSSPLKPSAQTTILKADVAATPYKIDDMRIPTENSAHEVQMTEAVLEPMQEVIVDKGKGVEGRDVQQHLTTQHDEDSAMSDAFTSGNSNAPSHLHWENVQSTPGNALGQGSPFGVLTPESTSIDASFVVVNDTSLSAIDALSNNLLSLSEGMDIDEPSTNAMPVNQTNNNQVPNGTFDIAKSIKGMYRILDLVSEQGSGGLVDKIIISQESLGHFINAILPGAYASMTKVDFKALDSLSIKPLGIYGSRSEIVKFLQDIKAIDDNLADTLRHSRDDGRAGPGLRSGLYALRPHTGSIIYVIYWPEETTWNDDAISAVQRNRITFMRFLTKIADQIIALISDEDASKIVWRDTSHDTPVDADDDEIDRLFTFQVAKTNEQEENVSIRPGFTLDLPKSEEVQGLYGQNIEPVLVAPRLVPGETVTGLLDVQYIPSHHNTRTFRESYSSRRLEQFLERDSFILSESLSEEALQILLGKGLGNKRNQDAVSEFRNSRRVADEAFRAQIKAREDEIRQKLQDNNARLVRALQRALVKSVLMTFSNVDGKMLSEQYSDQNEDELEAFLDDLFALHSKIRDRLSEVCKDRMFHKIPKKAYTMKKEQLLMLERILVEKRDLPVDEQREIVESGLKEHSVNSQGVISKIGSAFGSAVTGWLPANPPSAFSAPHVDQHFTQDHLKMAKVDAAKFDDADFLARLPSIVDEYPVLAEGAADVAKLAQEHLMESIHKRTHDIARFAEDVQLRDCKQQIQNQVDTDRRNQERESRCKFLASVRDAYRDGTEGVVIIQDVRSAYRFHQESFQVSGIREDRLDASLKYRIRTFELTETDKHMLQLDQSFVPAPKLYAGSAFSFGMPLGRRLLHLQLLQDERCLLIMDCKEEIRIYLDRIDVIENAVLHDKWKKKLHRSKIGNDFILAFDETKRMLAICAMDKSSLNVFVADEKFTSLQALGSQVDLRIWYPESQTKLVHAAFLCGASEELVLVDDGGHIRVYSLTTQQFRPASLDILTLPVSIHSSPDGSCLFTTEADSEGTYLRAYHWSNFGSTNGISLELPDFPRDSSIMTSIGNRSKVHYIGLDSARGQCRSFVLDISRKVTEFTFQERGGQASRANTGKLTFCNSLIDCHSDVWTRFPVVPAVRRTTANSAFSSTPRSLTFVSRLAPTLFQSHFSDLIANFERVTRKPTERELSGIVIQGATYESFRESDSLALSSYTCGEWLVNLLCLIPIHIAVTRDNRFIPLKDGVWSLELERSLLGATVEQIVDSLSFGWYESIFQSYLASKPVRVVSSMGEQSVGKSFALNHLVDTSFAGSAMRTTEGVWMSVTPTDDALIVALDFEGVHSIERSAQEDSLLVLFNTAMSNLVLFRNNFALSRDITGLFQSFQSSSTVLDPAANPTLFKSTLVIIIKDVVDSDKKEITKEFSLKFQKIVELEQGSNFITKLHGGNLAIIPWPVIESRQFYNLFPALKKMLDKQQVTHSKAGIFLQTMKTLMAKLKVNDWGALDQNLSSHRAQQLMSLLPRALMYGATEIEPEIEPLRDFDTGLTIDKPDSAAKFYLADTKASVQLAEQEHSLASLVNTWDLFGQRFDLSEQDWVEGLSNFLDGLANDRIDHVQEWLQVNTARFKGDSPQFEDIRRLYDSLVISLRSNIRLCTMQCSECQLLCLHARHHEGEHDCRTTHHCSHACQYVDEHAGNLESCGLPAGHAGGHICDISAHLCGQPCRLIGRGGCLERCSKVANHTDDEHVCPASHECGEHCSLVDIRLSDGSLFSCPESCRRPSNEPHNTHVCENRSCPIRCQLCKRLCASPDHLHALDSNAIHLCGQDHPCPASCQSPGICRIETTPQSIEATFTGRHETFQYTKYTQASRRLPCVIAVPAGQTEHHGKHLHSLEKSAFHFCEARCEDCGYFCTLPLGHTQQEHETSHGSMSRTKWAIDGQDGTVLEVNGRKFGATDDGAPMLCSMVCRNMGRHVHIDYCRSENANACSGADLEHISARMVPNPERAKDFISHALHWRRTDPYSQEERTSFSKCDSMCGGPEHQADTTGSAQPSYCNLGLFHRPLPAGQGPPGGIGYISRDGHHFSCRNPAQMQQAFHVIFVIDRSGSMGISDRRPLANTPMTGRIAAQHNNRVGAVYSSLHGFWQARASAMNAGVGNALNRRDAYSVVLFDHAVYKSVDNDFTSTPEQLLAKVLAYGAGGGTNYTAAVKEAQAIMEKNWSTERIPVVIFLSDGECSIEDQTIRDLCRRSVALGRPLSFHTVAFGPSNAILRRMAQIASEVQATVPADPMHPTVASSYTEALDTIRLAETFLGLAESLRRPRGSLMRG
ncbi:unnamed protein product [Somion occarium]|uniref:VWFA domain-containing protein n=1 Tax=Somion occarium TaxID=3059160 RepID=A0ABP1D2X6_9APHY